MSERLKAFWLGIFIVVALAILAWFMIFLHPTVGDGEKVLKVRFSNVEKIVPGTRVTFAGKSVGEVEEINEIFDARDHKSDANGNPYFYEVVLRIDSHVKVYSYDEIVFSTQGLLGEKTIAIVPKVTPKGKAPAREISGDVLYANSRDKLEETLQEFTDFFKENKCEMKQTMVSLRNASDELCLFVSRANEADLAHKTCKAMETVELAMSKVDLVFTQVYDSNLVGNLSGASGCLWQITNKIASGEGALGRLCSDESPILLLENTLTSMQTLIDDINNYGLLFQYDRRWQKAQKVRAAMADCIKNEKLSQECYQKCE